MSCIILQISNLRNQISVYYLIVTSFFHLAVDSSLSLYSIGCFLMLFWCCNVLMEIHLIHYCDMSSLIKMCLTIAYKQTSLMYQAVSPPFPLSHLSFKLLFSSSSVISSFSLSPPFLLLLLLHLFKPHLMIQGSIMTQQSGLVLLCPDYHKVTSYFSSLTPSLFLFSECLFFVQFLSLLSQFFFHCSQFSLKISSLNGRETKEGKINLYKLWPWIICKKDWRCVERGACKIQANLLSLLSARHE